MLSPVYKLLLVVLIIGLLPSCANIIPPDGGPKDSLPPKLVQCIPSNYAKQFNTNKIVLTFDEFVELKSAFEQVIVNPLPATNPIFDNKLQQITIKLKDTLAPNTTYQINFGNAIADINEGNVFKNFKYVFSTGKYVDSNQVEGKVTLAETGKTDSTLVAVLYKNLNDTAVKKTKPNYITRVNIKGEFKFEHLPTDSFRLYVMPKDFLLRYNDSTKMFAFLTQAIFTNSKQAYTLYAFEKNKKKAKNESQNAASKNAKFVSYQVLVDNKKIDINNPYFAIQFDRPVLIDTQKITLTDTLGKKFNYKLVVDTANNQLQVHSNWQLNQAIKLILNQKLAIDSQKKELEKNDTLVINTKSADDYGTLKIRFKHLSLQKNPVLQFLQNDKIVFTATCEQEVYYCKRMLPGDYDLRILWDENKNKQWDTGDFDQHKQPEYVQPISQKINVKAKWDNEIDIIL